MKIYRVVRWLLLAGLVVSILLALKSPQPLATPPNPEDAKANADSFQQKLADLEQAQQRGETGSEVRFTAAEVNSAIVQPAVPQPGLVTASRASQPAPATDQLSIKSTQVSFEDDVVKGQFLTQVYGRDVYITIAGHLGSKDGYATFEPTQFKVGDLVVPVSLVNPELQRKLAGPENRDKLKLPEFVRGLQVENGELVITE